MQLDIVECLQLAGAMHFFQIPGMLLLARRIIVLGAEFRKLSSVSRRIVYVLAAAIVLTVLGLGALVIVTASELAEGSRLAVGMLMFLSVFWGFRAACQIWYGGVWPRTLSARLMHGALLGLFFLKTALYVGALWAIRAAEHDAMSRQEHTGLATGRNPIQDDGFVAPLTLE